MSIKKEAFGAAEKYTLRGNGELEVCVLTYGATLQAIRYQGVDVALGYDTLEGYQRNDGYLGATVGRYANRIAGGRFTLNGKTYDVGCNEKGRGHLHGGKCGLDKKIWQAEPLEDAALRLTAALADGEEGYPGAMQIALTVAVEGDTLRLTYGAKSDGDTVFNPTNHCYFNLNGIGGASVINHMLTFDAAYFTPVDAVLIPTGELRSVTGTPFDFTAGKPIGEGIESSDPQVALCGGWDHNFVLDGEGFRRAAVAESPDTGIRMECHTTCPGLQFYAGNGLRTEEGKAGPMTPRQGFCLETQFFPDSPNHPAFPSATLRAGEEFTSVTEYRFSKK